jgi:hypothetical protein
MLVSQLLIGQPIVTSYSKRSGVIVSATRRPVCDFTGDVNEFTAYLVKYSPKDEYGKVNTDFYNYSTIYIRDEI